MILKMCILYGNCFITFSILSMLFFQYQASENNARGEDIASLDLIRNDLYPNNFINQDTLVHSISRSNENKYLRKRQVDKNEKQIKQRIPPSKMIKMKPSAPRPTTKKSQGGKPSNVKKTTRKTISKPTRPKITTKKQTKSKKSTTKKTLPRITQSKKTTSKPTTTAKADKFATVVHVLISDINGVRQYYNAPELNTSTTLSREAQKYADKLLKTKKWRDYEDAKYGVITYYTYDINHLYIPMKTWTNGWEKIDYNNLEKTISPALSQIVWVSSTEIGCAISEQKSEDGALTLCLFSPKGNIKGKCAFDQLDFAPNCSKNENDFANLKVIVFNDKTTEIRSFAYEVISQKENLLTYTVETPRGKFTCIYKVPIGEIEKSQNYKHILNETLPVAEYSFNELRYKVNCSVNANSYSQEGGRLKMKEESVINTNKVKMELYSALIIPEFESL
uniref:SCP domain-containing protein n=1 Tax=Strongyloides venezuelensis TaxID=75913 RepID=A0A0K0F325_STRVS